MLKTLAVATVVSLSLLASYWIGDTTSQRHNLLFNNVCLIDKTNVDLLEQSLAHITKAEAKVYGVNRINSARRRTIRFIYRYRDIAPCEIQVRIPRRTY